MSICFPFNPLSSRYLLFSLFLLFFLPFPLNATTFTFSNPTFTHREGEPIAPIELSNLPNTVFGLSQDGKLNATIQYAHTECDASQPPTCKPKFAFCRIASASAPTYTFVRSTGFERRYLVPPKFEFYYELAESACGTIDETISNCTTKPISCDNTKNSFQFPSGSPNEMYIALAVVCKDCNKTKFKDDLFPASGTLVYTNPDLRYPQLGFEENLFPILAAIPTAVLTLMFLLCVLGHPLAKLLRLSVPRIAFIVLGACFSKGLADALTFLYFWRVSQTGLRSDWYMYVRLTLAAAADISFIVVVMAMSSGMCVMPSVWFVDGRSPIFIVYVGVTLQAVIIIAVKLMFPFRYLGRLISSFSIPYVSNRCDSSNCVICSLGTAFILYSFLHTIICSRRNLYNCGRSYRLRHSLGFISKPLFLEALCKNDRAVSYPF